MGLQFTTIISVSAVIACTQGVFLLGLWLMDRRVVTLMWWAAAFAGMTTGASLAVWMAFGGPWLAGLAGGAAAIFAFGLVWQAARAFEGRSSVLAPAGCVALLWLGGAAMAGGEVDAGVLMASIVLLFALFLLLALREIWRGRSEALPSRKPLAIALGVATCCILLLVFPDMGPAAGGADASLPIGVWLTLAATIAISTGAALALGMTRERQQRARDVLAALDPQTGALNLGAFLGQAARLVAGQLKVRAPVTFVAVQLERTGGDGGVESRIRLVHDRLIALSRVTDIVARIRPGAFAVLMPNIEPDDALPLVQQVLRESAGAGAHTAAAARWDALRARVSLVSSSEVGYDLRAMILAAEGAMEETRDATADAFAIYRATRQEAGRRTIGDGPGRSSASGEPRDVNGWPAGAVLD